MIKKTIKSYKLNNIKKFTHGDFYNNIKNTVLIEQFINYIYPCFTAYKATFGIFRQNLFPNPLFFSLQFTIYI